MSELPKAVQLHNCRVNVWRESEDAETDGPVMVVVTEEGHHIDIPLSEDAHEHIIERLEEEEARAKTIHEMVEIEGEEDD